MIFVGGGGFELQCPVFLRLCLFLGKFFEDEIVFWVFVGFETKP